VPTIPHEVGDAMVSRSGAESRHGCDERAAPSRALRWYVLIHAFVTEVRMRRTPSGGTHTNQLAKLDRADLGR
jgi:hypothetical protein